MMDDLISRQAAICAILEDGTCLEKAGYLQLTMAERKQRDANILSALPSAQPERKTGRWIFEERKRLVDETDDGPVYRTEKWWLCSECGYAKGYQISKPSSNYCEDCGAKMLTTDN